MHLEELIIWHTKQAARNLELQLSSERLLTTENAKRYGLEKMYQENSARAKKELQFHAEAVAFLESLK